MPSIIGHTLVGLTFFSLLSLWFQKTDWKKLLILSAFCANAPDLDVIFHHLELDHIEFLAHRNGFFHSIFFSLIIGILTSLFFYKEKFIKMCFYFTLVCLSHSLFDSMTRGIGVVIFYPFSKVEYSFPFTPLLPAGFTPEEFQNSGIIIRELLYIWIPALIISLLSLRSSFKKS